MTSSFCPPLCPTFECEQVWVAPSHTNSFADCITNSNHLYNLLRDPIRLQYAGAVVVGVVVMVFTLLCCPFVTIMRYVCGCCGSHRRRPGAFFGGSEWDGVAEIVKQRAYDERCRKIVRVLPWRPPSHPWRCS